MTAKKLLTSLIAALLLTVCHSATEKVTATPGKCHFGEVEFDTITLENSFYRLIFVPGRGGRLVEWIDKRQGDANLIDLHREDAHPRYGGLLNEHAWPNHAAEIGEFWNYNFEWRLLQSGPDVAVLELWPEEVDILRRTITLTAGSPLIKIEFHLRNTTQDDGSNTLIRNVVVPSGGQNPADHIYSTPLTEGVRRDERLVNTARGANRPTMAAPWRAVGSRSEKRLVGFAFVDDLFQGAYDWPGSETRPTLEWYYRPLPAGKEARSTMWAFVAHGFTTAMHLSGQLVADFEVTRHDGQVAIAWALATLNAAVANATLETTITTLTGDQIAELPAITLTELKVDQRREGVLNWASDSPQPAVIRQRVVHAGTTIAEYEQPFELGQAAYSRAITWAPPAVISDIDGWQAEPPLKVIATAEDEKRGYLLYLNDGDSRGTSLQQVELTLGCGEYESIELCFRALRELGDTFSLAPLLPAGVPPELLQVSVAENLFVAKLWSKDRFGWKLNRRQSFTPDCDNDTRLWLIANSSSLKPGRHQLELQLTPQNGPPATLPIVLNVLPVKLPEDRHYFLEANTSFNRLGLDSSIKSGQCLWHKWEWNIPATEVYADDFHAHGGRMVTAYGSGTAPGDSYANIRLRATGEELLDALQRDTSWLAAEGDLPALDLSFWDPWVEIWLKRNFTRYRTTQGSITGYWNRHKRLSDRFKIEDEQRVRRWLSSETSRYLKEKGFRHLYTVIDDEIAPDKFEAWLRAARDARECGWSPGVTISGAFFRNEELYHAAGPIMEYWVLSRPARGLAAQARADGYLLPGHSVGSYEGNGGGRYRDYADTRASRWHNVMAEMDVFWIQCYIRKPGETIVFHDDEIPYASATWEGLRDGTEDGNYLKAALELIKLTTTTAPETARSFSNRLEVIVASINRFDASTVRQARSELLQLLLELRPHLPVARPSLLWEELPLIEAGTPRFKLAALPAATAAAGLLATEIERKTGIKMPLVKVNSADEIAGKTILFGHPDDAPWLSDALGNATGLGVSPTYPAAESYIIVERTSNANHTILVVGRGPGLDLGAAILGKMLKLNVDFPDQYYHHEE